MDFWHRNNTTRWGKR